MRIAVTLLNICSSLVSLTAVWLGLRVAYFGLLGLSHDDYSAIVFGGGSAAVFLITQAVSIIASTRLLQHRKGAAIAVSLIPLLLAVVATVAVVLLSYR
jgi:hypothetical protein